MQITFNLQHVLSPGSSLATSADARRILDECLTRLNRAKSHNGIATALYRIDGHCVNFDLPNVFYDGASRVDNAESLQSLLECLIAFNMLFLRRWKLSGGNHTLIPNLYASHVVYVRTQVWDAIPALFSCGYGDCKSLTAAIIAQYRMLGVEAFPVFRFAPPSKSKVVLFHILVQTLSGYEDPSKDRGMGLDENMWASIRQS